MLYEREKQQTRNGAPRLLQRSLSGEKGVQILFELKRIDTGGAGCVFRNLAVLLVCMLLIVLPCSLGGHLNGKRSLRGQGMRFGQLGPPYRAQRGSSTQATGSDKHGKDVSMASDAAVHRRLGL